MALDWQSLIATIASFAVVIVLFRQGYYRSSATAFALAATLTAGLAYATDFIVDVAAIQSTLVLSLIDLMWLIVAALLLVSLANFLREDKPPFARYPFFFTLLPLIVLPVYPFIADTVVIKNWVLALYQFGALAIAGLLFSLMSTKDKSYWIIVLSVALFAFAWLTKWIVDFQGSDRWVYTICVILGMILASKSFYDRANHQQQTNRN
jgi:hypothetical protein